MLYHIHMYYIYIDTFFRMLILTVLRYNRYFINIGLTCKICQYMKKKNVITAKKRVTFGFDCSEHNIMKIHRENS